MKKTILLTYAILGLAIVSIAQIDAAVKVGDSLYFFKGSDCIIHSLVTHETIDPSQKIKDVFPNMKFKDNLSSAFMFKGKLIFTQGNQYVEYDNKNKRGGTPIIIQPNTFGYPNLDAAFEFPNLEKPNESKVYFFKSNEYGINQKFGKINPDEKNVPISDWKGLGWSSIDAAITIDGNRVLFFKGDSIAEINVDDKSTITKSKIGDKGSIFDFPDDWFANIPPPTLPKTPPTPPEKSEIILGTQTWATKNLDVKTYRDGSGIEHVVDSVRWKTTTEGAWCYYDNDPSKGVLYNGYAVQDTAHGGIAPAGWHVPTSQEYGTLFKFYGGRNIAGSKMIDFNGFAALFGGYRDNSTGNFQVYKSHGYYLTSTLSTKTPSNILICLISTGDDTITTFAGQITAGFSVRLIKGNKPKETNKIQDTVVTIGTQTWMTKDLDVKKYRDGTSIKQVQKFADWKVLTDGAWCYYDISNPSKGVLYNWYAVNNKANGGLAPAGWYIPTKEELTTLSGNGIKMVNSMFRPGNGGFRDKDEDTVGYGQVSCYWSDTIISKPTFNSTAMVLIIDNNTKETLILADSFLLNTGLSVRCIKRVVQKKVAINNWPIRTRIEYTKKVTEKLSQAGYPEIQSRELSKEIVSELEHQYPVYDSLIKKPDYETIFAGVEKICRTKLKFPDPTQTIGKQIWMTNDLSVKTYRNGEIIYHAQTNEEWESWRYGAWCYVDNNDPQKGVLYNKYAVTDTRGLAPKGWHIPDKQEWETLSYNDIFRTKLLGNISPYSGKGLRETNGTFTSLKVGHLHNWWTATMDIYNNSNHFYFFAEMSNSYAYPYAGQCEKDTQLITGMSVRCIKDTY